MGDAMPRNDNGSYVIKRYPPLLLASDMDHQKAAFEGQVAFVLRNIEDTTDHGVLFSP